MQKLRLKNEETEAVAKCLQIAKEVQDAQMENMKKIKEVHRFYAMDHLSPVFLHQMGMNQTYEHCDAFVKHLEMYMQNMFKVEVSVLVKFV